MILYIESVSIIRIFIYPDSKIGNGGVRISETPLYWLMHHFIAIFWPQYYKLFKLKIQNNLLHLLSKDITKNYDVIMPSRWSFKICVISRNGYFSVFFCCTFFVILSIFTHFFSSPSSLASSWLDNTWNMNIEIIRQTLRDIQL